jgi:3',5'-cyclic AMP phosphodiesterase CpdA
MSPAMPEQFAHISDPHLTTLHNVRLTQLLNKRLLGYLSWRRRRRHEHRPEVLDALSRDLAANPPGQLVVTGDLTHIGLPQEFSQARKWLQQLGDAGQVALVPGNHDACVKAPWQDTFELWTDYLASDTAGSPPFPSLRVRGSIAFIGLSSACPTPPFMATGAVGREQLQRLPGLLETTRDQGLFRVIFIHHSPLVGTEKWRKRLTDAPALQAVIETSGAELVLHGHGHRAHCRKLETRHGTVPVMAVPSASALGLHGADIAHYNRYAVSRSENGWTLDLECRGYDPSVDGFVTDDRQSLHLKRG